VKGKLAINITTYPSTLPVSLINEKLKEKVHGKRKQGTQSIFPNYLGARDNGKGTLVAFLP
jgi:hypothetical protein